VCERTKRSRTAATWRDSFTNLTPIPLPPEGCEPLFGARTHRTSALTKWDSSHSGNPMWSETRWPTGAGVLVATKTPPSPDVARLGGHLLAANAKDDWSSHVYATLTRYEGHVPARVAWSGSSASRTLHRST
jgi:hypothetical protein